MTAPRRSLLLVSYFYPPTRDTGAQRPAAMAKWLARLGWDVRVLTTSAFGDEAAGWRSEAGGAEPTVIRTRDMQTWRARLAGHSKVDSLFDSDSYSGEPHPLSKVIVPEPLAVAWLPFARRAALRAHRRRPFDAVLTTSPPESAHAIGVALRRRGVPWVADIRDAWNYEPLRRPFPTAAQRRVDERLERRWLGAADAVVCVSEPAAADLRRRGIAEPSVIANAWDPDADPAPEAADGVDELLDPERISLVYTGRFGSYGRDPGPFAEAIGRFGAESPIEAERIEVAVAGPLTPQERSLFESAAGGPVKVSLLGSIQRERALALQRAADALLLLAQPRRSQLVNFKFFEYLAAGRRVLALAADTEAGRIAADAGIEPIVRADDPKSIAAALGALARGELRGPSADASERYCYPGAAEAMSAVLERAADGPPRPSGDRDQAL